MTWGRLVLQFHSQPTSRTLMRHVMSPKRWYVYILHGDRRLTGHAQHYTGFTNNPSRRMKEHSSPTTHVAIIREGFAKQGIQLRMARLISLPTKARAYELERYWKDKYKSSRHLCPICRPTIITRAGLSEFPDARIEEPLDVVIGGWDAKSYTEA